MYPIYAILSHNGSLCIQGGVDLYVHLSNVTTNLESEIICESSSMEKKKTYKKCINFV